MSMIDSVKAVLPMITTPTWQNHIDEFGVWDYDASPEAREAVENARKAVLALDDFDIPYVFHAQTTNDKDGGEVWTLANPVTKKDGPEAKSMAMFCVFIVACALDSWGNDNDD